MSAKFFLSPLEVGKTRRCRKQLERRHSRIFPTLPALLLSCLLSFFPLSCSPLLITSFVQTAVQQQTALPVACFLTSSKTTATTTTIL